MVRRSWDRDSEGAPASNAQWGWIGYGKWEWARPVGGDGHPGRRLAT